MEESATNLKKRCKKSTDPSLPLLAPNRVQESHQEEEPTKPKIFSLEIQSEYLESGNKNDSNGPSSDTHQCNDEEMALNGVVGVTEEELPGGSELQQEEEEDCGRERLKRHRIEVAGRVCIPEKWGQEDLLKDWIDCSAFDASLVHNGLMSARAALVEKEGDPIPVD